MKQATEPTIALIVSHEQGEPILADTLTSLEEILELELAMMNRDPEPLKRVLEYRLKQVSEEEEFADFVEGLLSQSFVKPDVQEHAVQWFKSRAKIESYQKAEDDASRVIALYAFQVYRNDPGRTDFLLAGPRAKVRIKVIDLDQSQYRSIA